MHNISISHDLKKKCYSKGISLYNKDLKHKSEKRLFDECNLSSSNKMKQVQNENTIGFGVPPRPERARAIRMERPKTSVRNAMALARDPFYSFKNPKYLPHTPVYGNKASLAHTKGHNVWNIMPKFFPGPKHSAKTESSKRKPPRTTHNSPKGYSPTTKKENDTSFFKPVINWFKSVKNSFTDEPKNKNNKQFSKDWFKTIDNRLTKQNTSMCNRNTSMCNRNTSMCNRNTSMCNKGSAKRNTSMCNKGSAKRNTSMCNKGSAKRNTSMYNQGSSKLNTTMYMMGYEPPKKKNQKTIDMFKMIEKALVKRNSSMHRSKSKKSKKSKK